MSRSIGRGSSRITLDEAGNLDEMVTVMGGDAPRIRKGHVQPDALTTHSETGVVVGVVVDVQWMTGYLKRLEKRVRALEAALESVDRTRRCPCCQDLTLEVIATGLHPEFGFAGIEQHEVRCGSPTCGYRGTRLYDPNNYIC
jgi:hypothetical protein